MAAKEFTQKMYGDDECANKNNIDSEVDTNHIQSTATAAEVNQENCFSAGTFAAIDKIDTIEDEQQLRVRSDRYQPVHKLVLEN